MPNLLEQFDPEVLARKLLNNDYRIQELHDLGDVQHHAIAETLKRYAEEANLDCRPHEGSRALQCLKQLATELESQSCIALAYLTEANCYKDQNVFTTTTQLLNQARAIYTALDNALGLVRVDITYVGIAHRRTLTQEQIVTMRNRAAALTAHPEGTRYRLDLEVNLGAYWCQSGFYQQAQTTLAQAYAELTAFGRKDHMLALALLWLGNTLFYQMRLVEAIIAYQSAIAHSGHIRRINLVCERNIAEAELRQTRYSHALKSLLSNLALAEKVQSQTDVIGAHQYLMLCYMGINDYELALREAEAIGDHYEQNNHLEEAVRVLVERATIEAFRGNTVAPHLDHAETLANQLDSMPLQLLVALRRAQLAMMQHNHELALSAIERCFLYEKNAPLSEILAARLIRAQLRFSQNPQQARSDIKLVLQQANRTIMPELCYRAYILLAQITERYAHTEPEQQQAMRYYTQAMILADRMQRSLALHLRGDFLGDKESAFQAIMRMSFNLGAATKAHTVAFGLKVLERWKAHPILASLADPMAFRLDTNPQHTTILRQLHEEQGLFYALTATNSMNIPQLAESNADQHQQRIKACVNTIRVLIDQLMQPIQQRIRPPQLIDIQQSLDHDEVALVYYQDGLHLVAIVIQRETLVAIPLTKPSNIPCELSEIEIRLRANIRNASQVNNYDSSQSLIGPCIKLLTMLYQWLISPLEHAIANQTKLTVIPYGSLHHLPFHLFYSDGQYLCERFEILMLPTLSLRTRRGPQYPQGMRILAHSQHNSPDGQHLDGRIEEAQQLTQRFQAQCYLESQATSAILREPPTQILHIAAHASMNLHKKRQLLSFIQLAEKINILDLLQLKLDYELVTLSGCETGVVATAAADQLIGLGHSILLTGAGALCVSLWQVRDKVWTAALMEHFYSALYKGLSKPAALRSAQQALLQQTPKLHPAFWGAFQLIGDPQPLSELEQG